MKTDATLEELVEIFLGKNITLNGKTVPIAALVRSLAALGSLNWGAVVTALQQGNWQADIAPIEDVLRIVGLFVPPVAAAEADFEAVLPILQFIFAMVKVPATVDVNGTWITPEWAADPRHQLEPDGTFRE